MLENRMDDGMWNGHQGDRRRQCQEHREFERAVLAVECSCIVARPQTAGQVRQQHNADGHPDHAERQLVQTVCIVEEGHGTGQRCRDHRGDQKVDLHNAA